MTAPRKISEYAEVAQRFQRSINLNKDWHNPNASSGYIVTPNVQQSLEQVCEGITAKGGQRALALTGPYGTGKSAFAVYLCQLLSRDSRQAKDAASLLPRSAPALKNRITSIRKPQAKQEGYLPVAVTARRRPVALLLLEGMLEALRELRKTASARSLSDRMETALQNSEWRDTAIVLDLLADLADAARQQGCSGILVLIDEAGKTLEYALQDREGGDVYIFQELAEYANRRTKTPILFVITLHQMFDDYVELSDRTLRNEWNKVQERFQPVQFAETAATTMQMVASALHHPVALPKVVRDRVDAAIKEALKSDLPLPSGIDSAEFTALAEKAWPLHPSVLLAVPHLFRRLAQNERSIFSYLTGHEPFGFQEHLAKDIGQDHGFIRLGDLYVYLLANFEASLARLPHAKRLLEANDIINSRQHLSESQLQLVRSVAMLNVLSGVSHLRATTPTLACASPSDTPLDHDLEMLKQQSVLTYRRLDRSFRVWEGSDVDIEARMSEGRRKLQMEGISPLETLCRHLPEKRLIARRHSLETGVHRYFEVQYVDALTESVMARAQSPEAVAGTVVVLLPDTTPRKALNAAKRHSVDADRVIVAIPQQIDALRSVVEEVACLRWVEENTEELRDDRIARRELSLRLAMGEQHIAQHIQTLLDPRPAPTGNSCVWVWKGENRAPGTPVDVAKLLSTVCDSIFTDSPMISNELVVRRKLSSAASAARRVLLVKMLEERGMERLGIEGYPPERSILESVLLAAGLYRKGSDGEWDFQAPPKTNDRNLRPAWDAMDRTIFANDIERVQLVDLFDTLSGVPYGIPDGLHPVIFVAFYLLYQDELFLYRDNTFVPDVRAAHLELLQRRPDLFSVSGARLTGTRKAVVERLAAGLNRPAKTASVVRALYAVLNLLPPITQRTAQIDDQMAVAMRDALLDASEPEKLLFNQLPACLGLDPFKQGQRRPKDMDLFFERMNRSLDVLREHASKLLAEKRDEILCTCGLARGTAGWAELERRATWLAPRIKHEVLTPFLNCVNNGIADDHNPRPALSHISQRSFEQWTDRDMESFPGLATGIGDLFQQVWHNYGEEGPKLTAQEEKQKATVQRKLNAQVHTLGKTNSPRAVAAAVRELLRSLEHDGI